MPSDNRVPEGAQRRRERHHRSLCSAQGVFRRLVPIENTLVAGFGAPMLPVVFILGVPRCGSTLLYQLLASTRAFYYPTNFLARFWMTPYLGMLLEANLGIGGASSFESDHGMTQGLGAPSEFEYFWVEWLRGEKYVLRGQLGAMESVHDKPLLFKQMHLTLHLPLLSVMLPTAVFIHCTRDPIYNLQSLLISREEFGNREQWWSLKPREYDALKDLDPYAQVAGQHHYLLKTIKEEAPSALEIAYEDVCIDPRKEVGKVMDLIGTDFDDSSIPKNFKSTNIQKLNDDDFSLLSEAHKQFSQT